MNTTTSIFLYKHNIISQHKISLSITCLSILKHEVQPLRLMEIF